MMTETVSIYGDASFAKMFDNGIVPVCPSSKVGYVVNYTEATTDITKFTIKCGATDEAGCPNFQKDSDGNAVS